MNPVEAELVTVEDGVPKNQEHIRIVFNGFQPHYIRELKKGAIPGARFINGNDPHWRIPIDIDLAKKMRALFGDDLALGPNLKKWAKAQIRKHEALTRIALADTAELVRLPEILPDLYKAIHLGPRGRFMSQEEKEHAWANEDASYQAADTLFVANSPNPLVCNQPGTGKTIITIAGIYEGEMEYGPKLVVAPITSHDNVWGPELEMWQDQPYTICPEGKKDRQAWMSEVKGRAEAGEDFWAILNWQMIQYRQDFVKCSEHRNRELPNGRTYKAKVAECKACDDCLDFLRADYPEVFEIEWTVKILDEFQKMGLSNPATLTFQALEDIPAKKCIGLSGTPMGGKAMNWFGILSFMDPKTYTSRWTFADTWLNVEKEDIIVRGGDTKTTKKVGGVKSDKEEAFYLMLARYMVRRTKEECLPWLPPKQYMGPDGKGIWVTMTGKQKAQYEEFAELAEIKIEDEELAATSVLAEYTYLKQFAMAAQIITGRDPETDRALILPTTDSCKIPPVLEILEERGIRGNGEGEGDEQVVIFTQFTRVADMLTDELQRLGYPAERLHGGTTKAKRKERVSSFQSDGGIRVLVMNVMAGGVSITLDKASTVIFLDETWNPDDQEQAEDRIHRGSRIHQVQIYYIRSRDTIEEEIERRVMDKSHINRDIMDLRRMGLRALHKGRK